jgi:glycosyltransferase involved in cell wall biosynthesis
MKQLFCLSRAPWLGNPSRDFHLVSRLKNRRIVCIDPPQGTPGACRWRDEGQQAGKSVTLHGAPPRGAAAETRRFFNGLYCKKLARHMGRLARDYAFDRPVIWLSDPFSAGVLRYVPHSAVLYDHTDAPCPLYRRLAEELARKADVVICQTEGAARALQAWTEHPLLLDNGVDYELFSRAKDTSLAFPDDLFTAKNPIFGHVGAVTEHTDLALPLAAAKARPDWTFVFIGECGESAQADELRALPNARFLGPKPQKLLPGYICRFDVCLSLHKTGELLADISPMKLYEYLASGKPVVSTPQPCRVLDYADVVYIAGSPEEFIESCRKAAAERDKWKVTQRGNYALAASWDARAAELERALAERGIP